MKGVSLTFIMLCNFCFALLDIPKIGLYDSFQQLKILEKLREFSGNFIQSTENHRKE